MSIAHIRELAFLRRPWSWQETALFQAVERCTMRLGLQERPNDAQVPGQICRRLQ
jgi:hypothetical protein